VLVPGAAFCAAPYTIGVKGGVAFTNVSPNDAGVVELERKLGPAMGAFVAWGLGERAALQGEILYVSKGFSYGEAEATDNAGNSIGTYESLGVLDYLEIPVLLQIPLMREGSVRPSVLLGPVVSFEVKEALKTTGAVEASTDTDNFENTDFGLAAGADVRFRTGPAWILVEARYTHGLTAVGKDFVDDPKNRAFMVMAGVAY
jgi:hypothetical protein